MATNLKPFAPSKASLGNFEEDSLIPTTKKSAKEIEEDRHKLEVKRKIEQIEEERRLKEESFQYFMEEFKDD